GIVSSAARIPFPSATSVSATFSRSWRVMRVPPCISLSLISPFPAGRRRRAEHPGLCAPNTCGQISIWPSPVDNLRPVGAVLVRVAEIVDDGVLHFLLEVRGLRTQLRHPIDHIDDEVEA